MRSLKKSLATVDLREFGYCFLIIATLSFLFFFIWIRGFNIPSSYTDISYHLSVSQAFARAGGIVTWDFWESLPLGRSHNYPPLFHTVLASLLRIGLTPTTSIKIMMELAVCGGLLAYTWGLTKLLNIKIAFWSLAALFASFHFVQLSATVMPATIVVLLAPALFYFALSSKWLSYSAMLILMFYLHLFVPYFILLSLFIYFLIFDIKRISPLVIFSTASFVFYLPWLTHVLLGGYEYIKYFNVNATNDMWNETVLINAAVLILFLSGVVLLFKNRKNLSKRYFFFLIAATLILSPSFLMASRLIDSHFLSFAAVLVGLTLLTLWELKWRIGAIFLIATSFFVTPILKIGENSDIVLAKSSIREFVSLKEEESKDPEIRYLNLLLALEKKSQPGDTITTLLTTFDGQTVDKNYRLSISNIFASDSKLSTLNLRQPEIYHEPLPDITKTKFLLSDNSYFEINAETFKDYGYENAADIYSYFKKNFQILSSVPTQNETNLYLFINSATDVIKEKIPERHFPLVLADTIILILIGLIIFDNKKTLTKVKQ